MAIYNILGNEISASFVYDSFVIVNRDEFRPEIIKSAKDLLDGIYGTISGVTYMPSSEMIEYEVGRYLGQDIAIEEPEMQKDLIY